MIYVLYFVYFCIATSVDKPCPDLQKTGEGMDAYVSGGDWHCASKLITEAHAGRVHEKATVFFSARSAATRVKKEAEAILRLLDKKFAIPTPISCAYRAKQNETHFMVVSRFAKIWDGQSAKWSSYSTKGGQGQVVHSEELPFEHIHVNATHAEMTITGEILNRRYVYHFHHNVFDYIIPEQSSYQVAFRDAQGSLQMSTGAKLPELQWTFRKRVPRWWPSLSVNAQEDEEQGLEDMEAIWEDSSEHFSVGSQDLAKQSPLTCAASFYCPSADTCEDNCAACAERPISVVMDRVCHRQNAPTITDISLWDTQGKKGIIAGELTWNVDLYDTQSVKVEVINVAGDTVLTSTVLPSEGYKVRSSKVSSVKLTALNYNGDASAPAVFQLVDNVAATGSVTATFTDEDLRPGFIAGTLKVKFSNDGSFTEVVAFYDLKRNSETITKKIGLEWKKGEVGRGTEAEYFISERQPMAVLTVFLSNHGSLQENGYDVAVLDAHRPRKPSVIVGLDWSREAPNDLDIEIRISSIEKNNKDRHRLLWGNGDLIIDLGASKFYRYQGRVVYPTIMAEAYNAFGATRSDEEEVDNIENESVPSGSEEKKKEEL